MLIVNHIYIFALFLFRSLNAQYEKLKTRIREEVDQTETEETCLIQYKKELELLIQEKMAHVEELRLIHADINSMESVIKESKSEYNQHLETAKHLYQESLNLKESMNLLRTSLGLKKLSERHEEDDTITPDFFKKNKFSDFVQSSETIDESMNNSLLAAAAAAANAQHSYLAAAAARAVKSGLSPDPSTVGMGPSGPSHPSPQPIVTNPLCGRQAPSTFRQQPPPMKACLSCHQQIHRNAPICPLCKAKSRSKNPKKPKRKLED